ncbi:MAG TPA: zinc ribbon domain-containing protein [Deferrisomatales bacterium]|nr:zinc ribbon domain-containing protein [Deferrisomatales bacterium]
MPLFEFTCPHCGESCEVLSRAADAAPAPNCPGCGREMTRRWSPVAAIGLGSTGCAAPRGGFS